ncbi:MAG TPA: hypothetical protein VFA12_16400 [Stellaceae bacterium]|nr:hypothetical protein [Stellaceae bacterium]
MRRILLLVIFSAAFFALPAIAQNPPQGAPVRVRGSVEKLDGKTLLVKTRDGQTVSVALADDASVIALVRKTLADIKPGDTVASTGRKGSDGVLRAIEVRVLSRPFADGGRQFPWDLGPDSVMTNATVGTVTKTADGAVVHVTFKGGESDYAITPETVILANSPADFSLLTPGRTVVAFALKHDDGSITARVVFAEKDGIKPPM